MNKRIAMLAVGLLFLSTASWQTALCVVDQKQPKKGPMSYQEIGDAYVGSFGSIEVDTPTPTITTPGSKPKLDLTIPTFSEPQLLKMHFELLARNEKKEAGFNEQTEEALRITLRDIDAYYGMGKDPQQNLVNSINNTNTVFGQASLAYLLSRPVADLSSLKRRQAFIKELVVNEALFNEVDTILKKTKKAESGFFSFFKPEDHTTSEFLRKLYWSKLPDSLNKNFPGAEAAVRSGNLGTLVAGFGAIPLNLAIMNLSNAMTKKIILGHPDNLFTIMSDNTKNAIADAKNGIAYFYTSLRDVPASRPLLLTIGGVVGLGVSIALGFQAWQAKNALADGREVRDAINYLQTRFIDVGTIVDTCKQLQDLAHKHGAMTSGLTSLGKIDEMLSGSTRTEHFARLVGMLQTNTFKGSASFFSLSGRVLAANRLMETEKENFAPALEALGEIDACLSMAKLYKKMQYERVNYSFVNFVETKTPYLSLIDFWNPFVDPNKVVTNSLVMGDGSDASKAILTGSNTGGKSTVLRAIMDSLVLARTFGIACARECTLSPLSFIASSLRVNDDTASGESLFKAEVNRAKMLYEIADSLPKNKFGFIVIDELFVGTAADKGTQAAIKVAQKLAEHTNIMYILSTHFPALTELEKTHKGIIKNYKVDAYKDSRGKIVRPYKLEAGVSNQNIANDILNEEIKDIDFGL